MKQPKTSHASKTHDKMQLRHFSTS